MKRLVRGAAFFGMTVAYPLAAMSACGSQSFTSADSSDASADSRGSDGDGTGSDGSALEGSALDAGPRFCESIQPVPFFCADFDNAGAPTEGFEQGLGRNAFTFLVDDAGTLAQADSDRLQDRLLLSSSLATLTNSSSAQARATTDDLGDAFQGSIDGGHFILDVDFRIDAFDVVPQVGSAVLFDLDLSGDLADTSYIALIRGGRLEVDIVANGTTTLDFGDTPSNGQWVHARFDVELNDTFTATMDGQPQSNGSHTTVLQTHPIVSIGLSSDGDTSAAGVVFDNVSLVVEGPDAG